MVNIGMGTAGLAAFLGYFVDFVGIVLLMIVIVIMGKVMHRGKKPAAIAAQGIKTIDLGSVNVPLGTDPKKAAVIFAAIAEEEHWGRVDIKAESSGKTGNTQLKKMAAISAAIAEEEEA